MGVLTRHYDDLYIEYQNLLICTIQGITSPHRASYRFFNHFFRDSPQFAYTSSNRTASALQPPGGPAMELRVITLGLDLTQLYLLMSFYLALAVSASSSLG